MTVSTALCAITRSWTGAEPNFPCGFPVDDTSTVVVTATPPAGAETELTAGVHYNLVRNPVTREAIVVPLAIAAPQTLRIRRHTPATQGVDLTNAHTFDAGVIEAELDRNAMRDAEQAQRLGDIFARALKVPPGETAGPLPSAAARAGKFLGFDTLGNPAAMNSGTATAVTIANILDATPLGKQLLQAATAAAARAIVGALSAAAMPKKTVVRVFNDSLGIFEGGFTAPLATLLGAEFTVVNESIGGDTLQDLLDRVNQDVRRMGDTDIVVAMPGINTVILAAEVATPSATVITNATAQLQAIWNALKASGIYVVWGTLPPLKGFVTSTPHYTWDANTQAAIDGINAYIMASTTIDRAVDTYGVLNDPANPGALKYDYDKVMDGHALQDHLHPNPDGYAAIASAFVASGVWPRRAADPTLEVLKAGLRLNQSLTEHDDVFFRSLSLGRHVNPGIATLNLRTPFDTNQPSTADDIPQLFREMVTTYGTGWGDHAKIDGSLQFGFWANGVRQFTRMYLASQGEENYGAGKWLWIDDAQPWAVRTSTYSGGNGAKMYAEPFTRSGTVVGWRLGVWSSGGGAVGELALKVHQLTVEIDGNDKFKIRPDGRLWLQYMPEYANNAAAVAAGLEAGDIYGINSGGTVTLARVS